MSWNNKLFPEQYMGDGLLLHEHQPGLKTALAVEEIQRKCVSGIGETGSNVIATISDNKLNIFVDVPSEEIEFDFDGETYMVLQKKASGEIGLDWVRAT